MSPKLNVDYPDISSEGNSLIVPQFFVPQISVILERIVRMEERMRKRLHAAMDGIEDGDMASVASCVPKSVIGTYKITYKLCAMI